MEWSLSSACGMTLPRTQLNTATVTETIHKNNFDELKQSLTDEINFANKDMDDAKKGLNHH